MIVDDANLRALDGRPQTEDKPVGYSFMGYTAPESDGA